ncbi:MAG TPA: VIT domain-containing protein [Tepidisphaeraceae bacterium]|jgi:Ca-activated chloride channel family protein|nr:VIT domain-containing protein [Tepidisphaeraceae bacterium]
MKLISQSIAALIILLSPILAHAQGIMIPEERVRVSGSYNIKNVTIDATIKDQVAEVQLSQVFHNPSSAQLNVSYLFPIPPDAIISQFTLLVDGKEFPAKLYPKDEADHIYESIVRSKKDPALLEYVGYGALQTQVFPLPPGAERKVTLRYTMLCRRDHDLTEFLFPLAPGKLSGKPIEKLELTMRLESPGRIKSVFSPNYSAAIDRPTDNSAIVRFSQDNIEPADDFRILWTLSEKPVGASVLSYKPNEKEDGYFLLLAAPEVKASTDKITPKTVIFCIDKSGSMAGKKIEQARNALKFVLNNLRDGDTFNIIAYDDKVDTFKPELQKCDDQTRAQALRYIDSIHDGGSTNIDGALKRAMSLIGETGRPSYLIFLTDGLPTAGEKREAAIAENARAANKSHLRLFAFGVGFDVNARLLDRLSTENSGTSEYVKPNQDIEASVAKFYGRMTAPVMTDIHLALANIDVNRLYPQILPDLFAGGQIIAVGRYRTAGPTTIHLSGRIGDQAQTFEFPATLAAPNSDETYAFVEKLWATRRVGDIINELDLKGKNQELLDELVRLSTKHGILTPYTAFLADERTNLNAPAANAVRLREEVFEKEEGLARATSGEAGVELRLAKKQLQEQRFALGGTQGWNDAKGVYHVEYGCQVVGNKALFKRSGRWTDPTVTPDDEKKAEQVEQFSDKYFELAKTNQNLRRYLALPEGCMVRDGAKVYQINVPQAPRG